MSSPSERLIAAGILREASNRYQKRANEYLMQGTGFRAFFSKRWEEMTMRMANSLFDTSTTLNRVASELESEK